MTIKTDIINHLHPKTLLPLPDTKVIEFDNKYDLLSFIAKHDPVGESIEYTKQFKDNIKNYEPDQTMVTKIKNQVINNLIKRGIISGTIYEGFKYDIEGEIIDHAMLASGNPMCIMKPIKKYDKWFYELYINMSIPGSVSDPEIEKGAIRLIETIKALEERNIEIKINIVDYSKNLYTNEPEKHLLVIIPLISHLEHKDYKNLAPFVMGSFLRGPFFTISRNSVENKSNVDSFMGNAYKLEKTVNLWELKEDSEIELAEWILKDLNLPYI